MTEKEGRQFNGFSPKTLKFLRWLKAHNDKAGFQAHKANYEEYVLQPLRDLVTDLGDFMLDIDHSFEITPVINKTISRIYRDTRFSKDKSPYRSTVSLIGNRDCFFALNLLKWTLGHSGKMFL